MLDMYFGDVDFPRFSVQLRGRLSVVLARLDLVGPMHENPDGLKIPAPHLHLYRQGDGDAWAYAIPADSFANLSDRRVVWMDFMRFCNITLPPAIRGEDFS